MKKGLLFILSICFIGGVSSCSSSSSATIVVGASFSPHAEILEQVKPLLKEQGYTLKIKTFSDYILPNTSLQDEELDANYFQHITYLNEFNIEHNTTLVSVGSIHYEPFGIYPGKKNSLSEISNNDVILVPNDKTNEARALLLLEEQGLITLRKDAGINATKNDIVSNPYSLDIKEINAELIPSLREDGAFAIINGNYAISAGISISSSLALEKSDGIAATNYANVLAVKEGNENEAKIKALYEALTSSKIKDYINQTYLGAVIPLF